MSIMKIAAAVAAVVASMTGSTSWQLVAAWIQLAVVMAEMSDIQGQLERLACLFDFLPDFEKVHYFYSIR